MYVEIVGRFGVGPGSREPRPAPPKSGKKRVRPEMIFYPEDERLTYSMPPFDPETELPPSQVVAALTPSGYADSTEAGALYEAVAIPKNIVPVPFSPEGVPEIEIPLPNRDPEVDYAGFGLSAWSE